MNSFDKNQLAEIKNKISALEHNLLDFIKEDYLTKQYNIKPGYSEKHIQKCINILNTCLANVQKSKSTKSVRRAINVSVLKLNLLHTVTKFMMIETMEREDIAEILNLIGYYKGAIEKDFDQTEKFRLW